MNLFLKNSQAKTISTHTGLGREEIGAGKRQNKFIPTMEVEGNNRYNTNSKLKGDAGRAGPLINK